MHPPIGEGVSTDFKSSNRIKISWLVQILLYFYWFGVPHPHGSGRWVEWVSGGLGMIWGPSRWCRDNGDNVRSMGMMWWPRGQHVETTETTDHGDHMGTFWGLWGQQGQHGDDGDDMGTTGTTCGDHGDNMWRSRRPQTMRTTWGPSGGYGDDVGMTGMMWGWWGWHRDHMGTKGTMWRPRGQWNH